MVKPHRNSSFKLSCTQPISKEPPLLLSRPLWVSSRGQWENVTTWPHTGGVSLEQRSGFGLWWVPSADQQIPCKCVSLTESDPTNLSFIFLTIFINAPWGVTESTDSYFVRLCHGNAEIFVNQRALKMHQGLSSLRKSTVLVGGSNPYDPRAWNPPLLTVSVQAMAPL